VDGLLRFARARNPDRRPPPGEIFVQRNVANVVSHTDLNCFSTIQFTVDIPKVEHIIVLGHCGCGGIQAVLDERRLSLVDNWLRHVGEVAQKHAIMLSSLEQKGSETKGVRDIIRTSLNVSDP
jgi:carbonic anhydrase